MCCYVDVVSAGNGYLFPLDCLFDNKEGIARSIQGVAVSSLFPFIVIIIFCLFFLFSTFKKEKSIVYLHHRCLVTLLSIFYVSYIGSIRALLKIMDCTDVEKGDHDFAIASSTYWIVDTDVKCYVGQHLVLVDVWIPVLSLICFGFPVWVIIVLARNKGDALDNKEMMGTYGFLYQSYKKKFHFWEVLVMIRKALIASIAVPGFSLGPSLQSTLGLGILIFAFGFHVTANPFKARIPYLNRMETISLSCSMLAFFSSILFSNPNVPYGGRVVISVVLMICIIATFLYLVLEFINEVIRRMEELLENIGVSDDASLPIKAWALIKHKITPLMTKLKGIGNK